LENETKKLLEDIKRLDVKYQQNNESIEEREKTGNFMLVVITHDENFVTSKLPPWNVLNIISSYLVTITAVPEST